MDWYRVYNILRFKFEYTNSIEWPVLFFIHNWWLNNYASLASPRSSTHPFSPFIFDFIYFICSMCEISLGSVSRQLSGWFNNWARHIPLSGEGAEQALLSGKGGSTGDIVQKIGYNSSSVCHIEILTTALCYINLFRKSRTEGGMTLEMAVWYFYLFMSSQNDCFNASSVKW